MIDAVDSEAYDVCSGGESQLFNGGLPVSRPRQKSLVAKNSFWRCAQ